MVDFKVTSHYEKALEIERIARENNRHDWRHELGIHGVLLPSVK